MFLLNVNAFFLLNIYYHPYITWGAIKYFSDLINEREYMSMSICIFNEHGNDAHVSVSDMIVAESYFKHVEDLSWQYIWSRFYNSLD